jgi:hypothetical protein
MIEMTGHDRAFIVTVATLVARTIDSRSICERA